MFVFVSSFCLMKISTSSLKLVHPLMAIQPLSLEVVQVPFPVCTNDELGHVYSSISPKTATVFNEKKKRSSTTVSLQDSTRRTGESFVRTYPVFSSSVCLPAWICRINDQM